MSKKLGFISVMCSSQLLSDCYSSAVAGDRSSPSR